MAVDPSFTAGVIPSPSALADFAEDSQITLETDSTHWQDNASMYIADAVRWLETQSGFSPFLASGVVTDRPYAPPMGGTRRGIVLDLQSGGVRDLTGLVVTTGYDPTDPASGRILTLNRDYFLCPMDAPNRNWPYTEIQFHTGLQNGILKVSANFGFCTALDDFVYLALLRWATASMVADTAGRDGQLSEIRQGPVTYKYAEEESTVGRLRGAAALAIRQVTR